MDMMDENGRLNALLTIDPDEMDEFEENCNMREERHRLLAKSPQGAGTYYCQPFGTDEWAWSSPGTAYTLDGSTQPPRNTYANMKEVDDKNRVATNVHITNRGAKYIQGNSKFGKVYIDLKFTRYVPTVGEDVFCIIGLNGSLSMPWKCFRIPIQ